MALWSWILRDVIVTLVTEESSPALHTITLPRFRARAVQTCWVPNTCVTEDTLVSRPTSENKILHWSAQHV